MICRRSLRRMPGPCPGQVLSESRLCRSTGGTAAAAASGVPVLQCGDRDSVVTGTVTLALTQPQAQATTWTRQ
jgi:hypothetical protein